MAVLRKGVGSSGLEEGGRVLFGGAALLPHHFHRLGGVGFLGKFVESSARDRVGDPLDVEGPDSLHDVLDHAQTPMAARIQ
jgi:hypothetical protein